MAKQLVTLSVNGEEREAVIESKKSLLDTLREDLYLTGPKKGCDMGVCGTCTVKVDGELASGCLTLAVRVQGKEIETIEGVKGADGGLHPMQESFIKRWAIQCGYCTPGMIMASIKLLEDNPHPTEGEIRHHLSGNLCRCTGYAKIIEAVQAVADGEV
ncbi:MAG: (2Fe-2S)-binding protein [Nitrospinota bacterium]|jgi:carbon-monoxide dehydrogenase small subunit|nr:(2Fe-2S)-binding protein [Nitrospinota bacterium]MDP6279172.1 (2Fe-2S)-binding protein [Nitrospinota bacterium]MDP6617809.1 (2Fe-2S)-binding protein [Nitrospinota bacterium]MDP7386013.1 (2Fe-2S)-binding protein [Nitrospinota bacterium]HJM43642.1 (2Fe-2S)-binding protein [Nitrospinota bacterium]|tara:strand:+ start:46 stop:519 length:474 start_codon:yes stop_codon:yes gene_type:complete